MRAFRYLCFSAIVSLACLKLLAGQSLESVPIDRVTMIQHEMRIGHVLSKSDARFLETTARSSNAANYPALLALATATQRRMYSSDRLCELLTKKLESSGDGQSRVYSQVLLDLFARGMTSNSVYWNRARAIVDRKEDATSIDKATWAFLHALFANKEPANRMIAGIVLCSKRNLSSSIRTECLRLVSNSLHSEPSNLRPYWQVVRAVLIRRSS